MTYLDFDTLLGSVKREGFGEMLRVVVVREAWWKGWRRSMWEGVLISTWGLVWDIGEVGMRIESFPGA
jgi:hypothetical protein